MGAVEYLGSYLILSHHCTRRIFVLDAILKLSWMMHFGMAIKNSNTVVAGGQQSMIPTKYFFSVVLFETGGKRKISRLNVEQFPFLLLFLCSLCPF
jgi:hypothetical protein